MDMVYDKHLKIRLSFLKRNPGDNCRGQAAHLTLWYFFSCAQAGIDFVNTSHTAPLWIGFTGRDTGGFYLLFYNRIWCLFLKLAR